MTMRRLILVAVAAAALTGAAPSGAATAAVTITRAGYVPEEVSVRVGDTVAWTNADTIVHQVVFDKYACNLTIQPAQLGSCTFTRAGSFTYRDPSQRGSFRGKITVVPASSATTISASRTTVVYGGAVTFSGQLASKQTGVTVELWAQATGQNAFAKVAQTTSGDNGNWTIAVKPAIQTVYHMRVGETTSQNVTIKVRPRVTLAYGAVTRLLTTKVLAAQSFAGKVVSFQRRSSLGQWVTLKKVTLNAGSAASFRARLPKGRSSVRVLLPASQTLPGYLGGVSPVRTVTR
jgi:plastocyanin